MSCKRWVELSRFFELEGVYGIKPEVWGRVGPDPLAAAALGLGRPGEI